ncbi:hypothetical protein BB561_002064 [Smittium simulii]|uniref:Inositol-pentakisphosphate 2-kinase n=1 Tax=Smittium simulii TaxID=133385 RepID=A0A2T9YRZ7_9FUNG|nr:hypothetical protein BB561_002064 [Smittium simulii]
MINTNEWAYKAEGNAHIVLVYTGKTPQHIGTVLKIKKAPIEKSGILESLETNRDLIDQQEYFELISGLLGAKFTTPAKRIYLSQKELQQIHIDIYKYRPINRLKKSIDFATPLIYQSIDASSCSGLENVYTVEFKPKWGFLPSSEFIGHSSASNLFELEQPFFRSFINGKECGLSHEEKQSLIFKISKVIYTSKVLMTLGKLQQLFDKYDIEHIKSVYEKNPDIVLGINDFRAAVRSYLNRDKQVKDTVAIKMAKFLISTTLKDVSILISFAQDNPGLVEYLKSNKTQPWEKYSSETAGTFYARIVIIDLDQKQQSKIPEYFLKDHKIVQNFIKKMNIGTD